MGVAAGFDGGLSRTLAVCLAAAGLVGIGLLVALLARGAPAPGYSASASAAKAKAGLAQAYGKLPLRFEENRGQSDPQVKFLSRGAGYSLFLTEREAVLSLIKKAKPPAPGSSAPARAQQDATAVVRMRPVGASPNARLTAGERLPGVSNYLRGGDHRRWQTGVPAYNRVRYQAVYPGVDLVYHGAQDKLEYDFVVAPGAEPGRIALSLTGAEKLTIDRRGDLILHTAAGQLRQQRPVVYQQAAGKKTPVPGRYVLLGKDRVGFSLGAYDRSRALVIDPVLAYSTYLGGSGSTDATDIAVDASGNAYVTGQTSSADFPTVGPYQSTHAGSGDVFVTKLNPAGSGLVYSTYIGGGGSDYAQAIAVDSSGNASVTGRTLSTNYPLQGATQVTNRGLGDAFVTKLNAAGSALIFSTYLGGEEFDEGRGIGVDSTGNVLLTGTTLSTTFPTTPSALQPIINPAPCGAGLPPRPCEEAFVTKLEPTGSTSYSTYLGGSATDGGLDLAVDPAGNAYVTGRTASIDFPTTGPAQPSNAGSVDAFATKLNPTGSARIYSTYLGGSSSDAGAGIALDSAGSAYVTGQTSSSDFPTVSPVQGTNRGTGDAFVTKLNAAGSARVYSTYLGGASADEATGIAVDAAGNAYVTGRTISNDFPTANPMVVPRGTFDAFVTKINAPGSALAYSTYLGGSSSDFGEGIAADSSGNAYVTGRTTSSNFPTANPAFLTGGAFISKVRLAADLSLTKTDAPDPVVAGQTLTYTLNASNAGPDVAQGVSVRDQLPAGVDFVSGSPGCSVSAGVVTCSVGELATGASVERQITVSVPAGAAGSTLSNTASVQASTFDPVAANNSASAQTAVSAPPVSGSSADLAIAKSDGPDPVLTGQDLTYALSASNGGPDAASGVVLRDQLPAGATFVSAGIGCTHDATTRVVTCAVGSLADDASVSREIVVRPTLPNPSLVNSATVSSQTADPVSSDNTSTATTNVRARADVSVTKTDSPDPVQVGEELTYTLTARNSGPDLASGVVVRDELPAGVELVSAAGCSPSGSTIICAVGDLANGASSARSIVVRPTRANPALSNTASVQTSAIDQASANDSASTTTEVHEAPTPPPSAPPSSSTPTVAAGVSPPPPVLPGESPIDWFGSQLARTFALRRCLAAVAAHQKAEQNRARRGSARQRANAQRHMSRHAASGRRACLKLHGRTPGQVTGLQARVLSATSVALSFLAPGTDGTRPPAARSYVVKQSRQAIASSRSFARARSLCKGACGFSVSQVGTRLTLTIAGLRPRSTHHFAIAARDNVSGRVGPRSATVRARTP